MRQYKSKDKSYFNVDEVSKDKIYLSKNLNVCSVLNMSNINGKYEWITISGGQKIQSDEKMEFSNIKKAIEYVAEDTEVFEFDSSSEFINFILVI